MHWKFARQNAILVSLGGKKLRPYKQKGVEIEFKSRFDNT